MLKPTNKPLLDKRCVVRMRIFAILHLYRKYRTLIGHFSTVLLRLLGRTGTNPQPIIISHSKYSSPLIRPIRIKNLLRPRPHLKHTRELMCSRTNNLAPLALPLCSMHLIR